MVLAQEQIMDVELTAPACLLFGLVNLDGQPCQLGVTLQYPPVQLLARSAPALTITGGRADLAAHQAERFYEFYRRPPPPPPPPPPRGVGGGVAPPPPPGGGGGA